MEAIRKILSNVDDSVQCEQQGGIFPHLLKPQVDRSSSSFFFFLLSSFLFSSVSTLQQVFLFSKEIQRHPDLSHFIPLLNCVSEIIPIKNNATI